MNTNKPTILIGPEPSKNPLNSGSWKWFGIDLANELGKYYNIIIQKNTELLKKADCYIVVKSWQFLYKVRSNKSKSVFLAVDNIKDVANVEDLLVIGTNHAVFNNEQIYLDYFKKHGKCSFIPHHIKYFYDGYTYRQTSSILWQGMEGNYKYVKEYLDNNYVKKHIDFLLSGKERDPNKDWRNLNWFSYKYFRNHLSWTEDRYERYLLNCSGFLDIKGDDFHQRYKPATKVLDALASGVPTAINDCGVRRYMETLGIDLAYPTDTEKWFSRDYFDYTQGLKWRIREEFNVEKIALQYKEVIDKVLEN